MRISQNTMGCSLACLLTAVVPAFSASAAKCTWTGTSSGYWDDGANWSTGVAPQAGDDVVINTWINNYFMVTVTNSTPVLNSLKVGETYICRLRTKGWNTCIRANSVTIGKKGVVMCDAGGSDIADISRVWIECGDLTVVKNGTITASIKGYVAVRDGEKYKLGAGPGAGLGSKQYFGQSGGAHGGYGGICRGRATIPYGDPSAPETPGSSGSVSGWASEIWRNPSAEWNNGTTISAENIGNVVPGGGVVRIDATGTVTVNGAILANSCDTVACGAYSNDQTAGAGGSIYITANAIKGQNGTIRADGGSSSCPTNYLASNVIAGAVGGGGRIAIKYNPESQLDGYVSGMTISAAPGSFKWKESSSGISCALDGNDIDKYRSEGGLGTLWFTDQKMLESLGTGITGQILNLPSPTFDSLVMTNGHVRFASEGVRLNVTGDLVVSGRYARIEVGGSTFTNRIAFADLYTANAPNMSVGGNLVVVDGGRLDIRSAATNGIDFVGANVFVAGTFNVASGGVVKCWSDSVTGGSPRFEVGNFTVAEGGLVSADALGYAGGWIRSYGSSTGRTTGYGPGYGMVRSGQNAGGGGHGGRGGLFRPKDSGDAGRTYDNAYWPCMAGSGGAVGWNYCYYAGCGGGVIDGRATGAVVVDGTSSANGGVGAVNKVGAGSGGTVYLYGKTFSGGMTGIISACGGDAGSSSNPECSGAGGGGRISVWAGVPYTISIKDSRITRVSGAPEMEGFSFLGTVSADGGMPRAENTDTITYTPGDGTVWFTYVREKNGLVLNFK